MVTKKKTAARPKTRTVYKTVKARRSKSASAMIPAAAATLGLAYANKDYIGYTVKVLTNGSNLNDKVHWAMNNYPNMLKADRLKKDAIYAGAAYLGGHVVKKYAPAAIKKPLGAIAKKVPKIRGL